MEIEKFGIAERHAAALVRGVAQGHYSLFTGAGFSYGASAKAGLVPTAQGCAEALNQKFNLGLKITSAFDLPLAYEDALESTAGPDGVHAYFEQLFTGTRPTWQAVVARFAWKRIWSVNVDDLPEAIWRETSRRLSHIDFSDRYRPIDTGIDELQIIYLHGRAAIKRKSHGRYIFSVPEYADATRDPRAWHTAFFTEFSDRPMIVCGASLTGEVDLSRTFRSGSQSEVSTGMPSIAVIKDLDEAGAKRLRRLGLLPICTDGANFFAALSLDVDEFNAAHVPVVSAKASPSDARTFGSQFRLLSSDVPTVERGRHDFHAGDEPEWSDIQKGEDARLHFADEAVAFLRAELQAGRNPVVTIVGDAGSGKTATLLRVLKDAGAFSDAVYLFRGEEGISVASALACLSPTHKTLMGFDLGADFSVDIAALLRGAAERGLPLAVVVADRLRRKRGLINDIRSPSRLVIDHSKVSSGDAIRVYEARKRKHRLGNYLPKPPGDFRKLIVQKHAGNLFSGLAEVEGGRGYFRRLDDHVDTLATNERYTLLAHAVCLTHRWGYSLPLRSASLASGVPIAAIAELSGDAGALADVFVIDRKGLRFRHRALADHYFSRFARKEMLFDAAKSIVESLAPLITIDAIRSRSYSYLICRVLMERRSVTAAVGSIDRAREFFTELEPAFGGNSRFWEQRALLESEAHNHSRAYSYAHEAVNRERHTFPLTTLGRVCMAQAVEIAATSPAAALEKFKEGTAALLEARAIGQHRPETLGHPFTCFFDYAARFYPVAARITGSGTDLRSTWDAWYSDAARTKVFGDDTALESYRLKWLRAVVGDGTTA